MKRTFIEYYENQAISYLYHINSYLRGYISVHCCQDTAAQDYCLCMKFLHVMAPCLIFLSNILHKYGKQFFKQM